MNRRCSLVVQLVLLLFGLIGWPLSAAPATEIVARVHWLGLDRIAADTNSARLMDVWRLPQTAALETQALDKLSRWPGHGATYAASNLLRPLFDDLISSEFYFELSAPTNSLPRRSEAKADRRATRSSLYAAGGGEGRGEVAVVDLQPYGSLAVHLPADRARLWQTNLAAALKTLTGDHPISTRNGWVFSPTNGPARIEFSRAGEWTLVGWGPDTKKALSELPARIARDRAPTTSSFWLEADLNPSAIFSLSAAIPLSASNGEKVAKPDEVPVSKAASKTISTLNTQLSTLNRLRITVTGEAGEVVTHGTLDFSRPLDLPLSPWEIPTNLIHQPLTGFTAMRGFGPWLANLPAWQKLGLAQPPDQAYFWAPFGGFFQIGLAAPLPAASNQLRQLAARLVEDTNPWLAANAEGYFQWQTNPPALLWKRALILAPSLSPVRANQQDYVLGGLVPFEEGNTNPPPLEVLGVVCGTTNLIYYQTEQTRRRIQDDLYVIPFFRLIFHKPELPTAAALWLESLEPSLGNSVTFVTQTGADRLSFNRTATIGLTGLELQLLADWLESPRFPYGLHTFSAQ